MNCRIAPLLLTLAAATPAAADGWQPLGDIREAALGLAELQPGADTAALDPRLRLPACAGALQAVAGPRSNTGLTVAVSCAAPTWSVHVPVRFSQPLAAPVRLVKRGELVTLLGRAGAIEVRAQGKALGDGYAGDSIQVQNTSSSRIVGGVVRAAGLVEVNL